MPKNRAEDNLAWVREDPKAWLMAQGHALLLLLVSYMARFWTCEIYEHAWVDAKKRYCSRCWIPWERYAQGLYEK